MTDFSRSSPPERSLTNRPDLSFVLKAASLGLWEIDPVAGLVSLDNRGSELFGLGNEPVITLKEFLSAIHPDAADRLNALIESTMNPPAGGDFELNCHTVGASDEERQWIRLAGQLTLDAAGQLERITGIVLAIPRPTQDRQQPVGVEQLRNLIEQAPVAMALFWGPEFVITLANKQVLEYWGRQRHQVIDKPLFKALPEASGQGFEELLTGVLTTGKRFTAKELTVTLERNGKLEQTYINFVYEPIHEPDGTIDGVLVVCSEITEQVHARRQAEEKEAQIRSIINSAPAAIGLFVGRDLVVEMPNQAFIDIVGKGPGIAGKPLREVTPELESQPYLQILDEVFTSGRAFQSFASQVSIVQQGVMTHNYYNITYTPLLDAEGMVYAILDVAIDVTEQKKAQDELDRFRYMAENARDPFVLMRQDGSFAYLNQPALDRWGYTADDLPRLRVYDVDLIYQESEFQALFARVQTEKIHVFETLHRRADGTTYPVEVSLGSFQFADEPLLFAVVRDLTERKKSEERLRESEERFRTMAESTSIMIAVGDESSNATYFNKAWVDFTGRSMKELLDFGWVDLVHPDDRENYLNLYLDAFAKKLPFVGEFRARNRQGEYRWLLASGPPRFQSNGDFAGYISSCVDITDRKRAEEEQKAGEARFRSIIEEAPIATFLLIGPELTIEIANESMLKVLGKGRDIFGKPYAEVVPDLEHQACLVRLTTVYQTGEAYKENGVRVELVVDGVPGVFYFDYVYKPLRDLKGSVYGILCMAVDVTAQTTTRQQIEASEREYRTLSARLDKLVDQRTQELQLAVQDLQRSNQNLQQFAYVASHDLQEPLRKIQAFGDLLKGQFGSQLGNGVDYLDRMQASANRMSTLIKDLLTYSRVSTQQESSEQVPLARLLETIVSDLDLAIQETAAQLTVEPLPTVRGDGSQLNQLFQNLLNNALKFRQPGTPPVIRVSCQLLSSADLPLSVRPSRPAAHFYRIDVADNGIGFDDKYTDRIFQVFQRLHGRNQFPGTGIGLAICEKVVLNHGGAISARSEPGQGATFSIYLPQ